MADAKKARTPPQGISTAATVHGRDAFGARFVKKGFAFADEHDLQFALGWPFLYELAEGHDDDADPAASALAICNVRTTRGIFGRETAHKLARGWAVGGTTDMHGKPLPEFVQAMAKNGPVTPDEAHDLVRKLIQTDSVHKLFNLLLVCEALVGPDATVNGALEGLSETPPEVVWGHSTNRDHEPALSALGLILLRLREADRDRALARWRKLYERWRSEAGEKDSPILDATLAVLSPEELIASEGPLFHLDDPDGVIAWRKEFGKNKPTDDDFPNPRFVFLGGEGVYRTELAVWSKYKSSFHPAGDTHPVIFERFSRVQSPLTVELMLELGDKSKAKKRALAWLVEHADYARPELERLAKKGPLAALAKAALA